MSNPKNNDNLGKSLNSLRTDTDISLDILRILGSLDFEEEEENRRKSDSQLSTASDTAILTSKKSIQKSDYINKSELLNMHDNEDNSSNNNNDISNSNNYNNNNTNNNNNNNNNISINNDINKNNNVQDLDEKNDANTSYQKKSKAKERRTISMHIPPTYTSLKIGKSNSNSINNSNVHKNSTIQDFISQQYGIDAQLINKVRASTIAYFNQNQNQYSKLPELSGWLLKQSPLGLWQRRWVIVRRTHMLWNDKQEEIFDVLDPKERSKFKNSITLLTISKVDFVHPSKNKVAKIKNETKFYIQTHNKTYNFRALSEEDRDYWVEGLNKHLQALQSAINYLQGRRTIAKD